MSTPYVPSVFVPGQQHQQPSNASPYRSYFPDQQQQRLHVSGQPYAPDQQPPAVASRPYVPVQSQPVQQSASYRPAYVSGQAPQPQIEANSYSANTQPQHIPAHAVPNNGIPDQQVGACDPNDPDGERGLLTTGGKIAVGLGAAAVAYQAYSQLQQHQQPSIYGSAAQPAFGGGAQQPVEPPQRRGVLTIYLDRLTDLANKDLFSKSDPYVTLSIEQDNWVRDLDYGKQVSSRKNDDLNPVYNEVFHFNLPTLKNMVLSVRVVDDDGGLTSDDKMGSCKIKLWKLGLNEFPQPVERVIDRNVISKNGKCHLRLAYSG